MIRAHHIGETSTFLGQTCALCKQEFAAGDEIVICPADGSRHHVGCWQANNNKCTAYGCRGEGAVGTPVVLRPRGRSDPERSTHRPRVITQEPERSRADAHPARPVPNAPGSKVRTLPAGGVGCGRTCLLLAVALAIILLAVGCFGLWAITDYLMLQLWDIPYRLPLSEGLISLLSLPYL